jgi:uncharacterized protein (TIGR03437 family)
MPYKLLFGTFLAASLLSSQPRIDQGGILNAASYGSLTAPGSGIAQGAMAVFFGDGLGPSALQSATSLPLPTELGGTRVRIGGQDAYLIYTSARQVSAIIPSTTALGAADIVISYNGQSSQPRRVNVVAADFGIFTRNSAGYGSAIVQNFVSESSVPLNQLTASATPGQTLILYGTGLGGIDVADNIAPGAKPARVPVHVTAGGRTVTPAYAGRSPNFPGLDQINFVLPADTATGCYVPVTVRAGNRVSNAVSIAVRAGGSVCQHPLGLDKAALRRLDAGQTLTVGILNLNKFNLAGLTGGESAAASFREVDASGVFVQSGLGTFASLLPLPIDVSSVTVGAPGQCFVTNLNPQDTTDTPELPSNPAVRLLDAGASLRLSGPAGKTGNLTKAQGDGSYAATLSSSFFGGAAGTFLQPGAWQITSTGGADIGAFTATLNLPDPLKLSAPAGSINRSQPFAVNWTGGAGNDVVLILGVSIPGGLLNAGNGPLGAFICTALASARTFTVPSSVLSQLQAAEGALALIGSGSEARPVIPLVRGGNIDLSAFSYAFIDSALTRFQ